MTENDKGLIRTKNHIILHECARCVSLNEQHCRNWRICIRKDTEIRLRQTYNKTWVFGIAQRGTRMARFFVVPDRKNSTQHPILEQHVARTAKIFHDDWAGYRNLENIGFQEHGAVVHKKEFKSKKGVCTNLIEGNYEYIAEKSLPCFHLTTTDFWLNICVRKTVLMNF